VAVAYAREGADVLIAHLDEHDDTRETARWVERAGRKAVLVHGDLASADRCRTVIDAAVAEFGRVDVLVSNAAQRRPAKDTRQGGGHPRRGMGQHYAIGTDMAKHDVDQRVRPSGDIDAG
jgi:NAD(P)-dependent dehydrogenase (short-subunit alcohol dehydrogenase family)